MLRLLHPLLPLLQTQPRVPLHAGIKQYYDLYSILNDFSFSPGLGKKNQLRTPYWVASLGIFGVFLGFWYYYHWVFWYYIMGYIQFRHVPLTHRVPLNPHSVPLSTCRSTREGRYGGGWSPRLSSASSSRRLFSSSVGQWCKLEPRL